MRNTFQFVRTAALNVTSRSVPEISRLTSSNLNAAVPTFRPSDVHKCQQDVPFNETLAVKQIAWLQSYIQFQTTLSYLKNPPAGYQLPSVDLVSQLNAISQGASSGHYENEFEFETDIFSVIASVGDGHLTFIPFLMGAFLFSRKDDLVSVSEDGIKSPKVYIRSESSPSGW